MKLLPALLAFLTLSLLVACGGGSDGDAPRRGRVATDQVLRINIGPAPRSIDPSLMTTVPDSRVLHTLMEGLVRLDENNEAQPALATSWEVSPDSRTFTFRLRNNAVWHNGDPVTAHDFVFGLRRVLTGSLAAEYATMVAELLLDGPEYYAAGGLDSDAPFRGAEALDDHTLVLRTVNPSPFLTSVISLPIWFPVNERAVREGGAAWANSPRTFVGNGPFRLVRFAPGDVIVVERFDDYWDRENIFWERIEMRMIVSENTLNAAYLSGDIDVTNTVPVAEVSFWRDRPDLRVVEGLGVYYLAFNTARAPFDDPRVRRAFLISINRDIIVSRVTRRGESVAQGFVPAKMPGVAAETFRETAGDLIGPRDVEEARRLIAEVGRNLPPVEYIFNVLDEHRLIAEQVQAQWREALGVDVRLQQMEFSELKRRMIGGDFQVARSGWIGDYVDPLTFLELFVTDGSANDPQYSNPRFDELIAAARQEEDLLRREALFAEAERILIFEDAVVAPIYDYVFAFLVRPEIQGITMNSLAGLDFVRSRRVRE